MGTDLSDLARASHDAAKKGDDLEAQWRKWLVTGTWFALFTVVAYIFQRPCPDLTFIALLPTVGGLCVGAVSALASIMCASKAKQRFAEHLAHAYNREELRGAVERTPEWFSAPRRIAEEANEPRNALIKKCNLEHAKAEAAWPWVVLWRGLSSVLTAVVIVAILVSFTWPAIQVLRGGSLVPMHCSDG